MSLFRRNELGTSSPTTCARTLDLLLSHQQIHQREGKSYKPADQQSAVGSPIACRVFPVRQIPERKTELNPFQ